MMKLKIVACAMMVITFLVIPKTYGNLSGLGVIQAMSYTWDVTGEFLVGRPLRISGQFTFRGNNVKMIQVGVSGCGLDEYHELKDSVWIGQEGEKHASFAFTVTPPSAGVLVFEIDVVFNSTWYSGSIPSHVSGGYVGFGVAGPAAGAVMIHLLIGSEAPVSQSDYNSLKSQYDTLKIGYDALNSDHASLISNYQALQADYQNGRTFLGSLTIVLAILVGVGFGLYLLERSKPKLPRPPPPG